VSSGSKHGAGASSYEGIVFGRGSVEQRMLDEQGDAERGECGVEEVDDDDLGGGEQTKELMRGHRLRAATTVLGLGGWAKTSR
jgi:hypothetical protein